MTAKRVQETRKQSITIGYLFETNKKRLRLTSLTGEIGFGKEIKDKNIHRPGLALAGYVQLFRYDRVQVCGNTEMKYLDQLKQEERRQALKKILDFDVPCIIVTNSNPIDEYFVNM
ncbi:MAG TPA: HPr kinase/phosphorylase, partial [Bacteroidota bacterium]|nr:HPr kinase/phosphorylase [Bacteroidota bacterium]